MKKSCKRHQNLPFVWECFRELDALRFLFEILDQSPHISTVDVVKDGVDVGLPVHVVPVVAGLLHVVAANSCVLDRIETQQQRRWIWNV